MTTAPALGSPAPEGTPLLPAPVDPVRPAGPNETASVDDRVAFLLGRLRSVAAHDPDVLATVAARWPADTPTLTAHDVTPLVPWQLDQIEALISATEQAVEAPFFPELDPTARVVPDDPRIADLAGRYGRLPADLQHVVGLAAQDAGIPKLSEGPTVRQLDALDTLVTEQAAVFDDRCNRLITSLNFLPEHDDICATALAYAGCTFGPLDGWWPCTETQAQIVSDLADVLRLDPAPVAVTSDGIVVTDTAIDDLAARFGGKRPLLSAAKEAADALGVDRPSACADLASTPQVVARLALTDVTA